MRKSIIMLAVFFVLALGLVVACVPLPPPPAVEAPLLTETPTVVPSATPVVPRHAVAVAEQQASTASHMASAVGFEYAIADERYGVSLDALLMPLMFGMPGLEGTPRLALARVVTGEVGAPQADVAITWVLFTADPVTGTAVVWRETWVQPAADGVSPVQALDILVAAGDVVAFAAAPDAPTGLSGLVQARDDYMARTGENVWVDQLLLAEPAGQGGTRWVSYVFNNDPGGGAGDEARRAYCCRLLRCGSATDFWGRLLCRARCGSVGC